MESRLRAVVFGGARAAIDRYRGWLSRFRTDDLPVFAMRAAVRATPASQRLNGILSVRSSLERVVGVSAPSSTMRRQP